MNQKCPRILVTGANGFIGRNLVLRFDKELNWVVTTFVKSDPISKLRESLKQTDCCSFGRRKPSQRST